MGVRQQGWAPEAWNLTERRDLLVEGTNVLAVEGHDVSATSSDMSLTPFLTLGLA